MKFWEFLNKNDDKHVELRIEGDIIDDDEAWFYEWFGESTASPNAFRSEIAEHEGKNLTVWVDSNGGSVFAGAGIYNALKEHKGKVTVKVDGKAMSAASVIAMAGDEVQMSPGSIMMIHNPLTGVYGNQHDIRKVADILDEIKESIINVYELKSGRTREDISQMMDDEKYMSAKTAVNEGFADSVMYSDSDQTIENSFAFNRMAIVNSAKDDFEKVLNRSRADEREVLSLELDLLLKRGEKNMNKNLRDLIDRIENKKTEARQLLSENKLDEAKALRDEIQEMQNKFDVAKDLYDQEKKEIEDKVANEPFERKDGEVKTFVNHVRTHFRNAMSEGSDEDGGYTVPQDIQTKINEYRESKDALQNLVTVESVSTKTGSRVFKTRAQQTGFAKVDEMGEIPEKSTPQFTNLEYDVEKYAGFMRVTNELLKDSDQAITGVITKWIGDESRVTRNKEILEVLDEKDKVDFDDPDAIKTALNVTLDPAFRYTSTIVTNQDGYNYLDLLKDGNGNYLLQPSVSAASGKQLFGVDVQIVSNKDLPSDGDKAPIIVGDLKEAVVLFDRETTDIMSSNVAADAYLTDVTLFRAIERLDIKMRDEEAFVYGQIDLTEAP